MIIIKKIKNKILFLLVLFTISFNYINFIGFTEVKDDNIDYLKYSLNFAIHNKQSMNSHQDLEIIFDDERSVGYPFLNSIFLKKDKDKLLEKNLNCFLVGEDEYCKKIIIKLQRINFVLYVLIVFSILIITFKIINSLFFALLFSLIFSLNTFFVSNISYINPETISALIILWLSYFTYKFYQTEDYTSQILLCLLSSLIYFFKPAFIFYLLFLLLINIFLNMKICKSLKKNNLKIVLIFIISISPVLFLKYLTFDKVKKITKTSNTIINIKEKYYEKYSPYKNQNIMKDSNNHDNFLPDNTGGEVLLARDVYSFIKWNEIPPLIISFLPVINNYLLDKFYETHEIERIKPGASFEGRNRNYFLIYRKFISEDYLLNNGYNLQETNTLQKSGIIYFSATLKQFVLTPIFAFRGIFGITNFNDLNERFNNSFKLKLYKSLAIFTFCIQFFSLFLLFYYFVKFIFKDNNINYVYFIMVPSYSIVFHSVFTHYIPRYSQPLMPVAYLFLGILLYELICKKNKL